MAPPTDAQHRAFASFLAVHAHKARPTETPVAYVQFAGADGSLPAADAPLLRLDGDDVPDVVDPACPSGRWLRRQMQTYDCTRQRVVGLIFSRTCVISEVLRLPPDDPARAAPPTAR